MNIATTKLPDGIEGTAYGETLVASNGTAPYAWSISLGSLPDGITLDGSTGTISGTPATAGSWSFTALVADSSSPIQTDSQALGITVVAPLNLTSAILPDGTVDANYSQAVAATGGATPYSWSIASGSLPDGLSLQGSAGVISGVPTAFGAFGFNLQAQDSSDPAQFAVKQLSITVAAAPLSIATTVLDDGTEGGPTVNSCPPPAAWRPMPGAIPRVVCPRA